MESGPSIQSTVPLSTTTKNTRRRPLHTCGVTILAIGSKGYTKASNVHGPVGTLVQKLDKYLGPIIYMLQYHWLATLSYTDDQILAVEDIVETVFPPSSYVFDHIDSMVNMSESFPKKIDDLMCRLLMQMYRVPFLNWALAYLFITLNFLITALTDWEVHDPTEKEIMMDINSQDHASEPPLEIDTTPQEEPGLVEKHTTETKTATNEKDVPCGDSVGQHKSTYKEVLLEDHYIADQRPPQVDPTTDQEDSELVEKHTTETSTKAHTEKDDLPSDGDSPVPSSGGSDDAGQPKSTYKEVLMEEKKEEKIHKEIKVEPKKEHLSYKEVLKMGTKKENTLYEDSKTQLVTSSREKDKVLEMGTNSENTKDSNEKEAPKSSKYATLIEDDDYDDDLKEDSILELFANGWHINPL